MSLGRAGLLENRRGLVRAVSEGPNKFALRGQAYSQAVDHGLGATPRPNYFDSDRMRDSVLVRQVVLVVFMVGGAVRRSRDSGFSPE